MKETELKIGDWVNYKNESIKIEELSYELCGGIDKQGFWHDKVVLDDIEPTPLTKEILEKSGWEIRDTIGSCHDHYILCCLNNFLVYFEDDGTTHIEWYNSTNHLKFDNIKYVHQLQHILWALGINDNLKV